LDNRKGCPQFGQCHALKSRKQDIPALTIQMYPVSNNGGGSQEFLKGGPIQGVSGTVPLKLKQNMKLAYKL